MNATLKLIILLFIGIAVWFFSPFIYSIFKHFYSVESYSDRGVFGDSFGAVTSLFSFLSFIAVIFTFYRNKDIDNEKTRPFVITVVDGQSLSKFHVKESPDDITLEFKIKLKNYSDYLAHSVNIQTSIIAKDTHLSNKSVSLHYPLINNEVDAPLIIINSSRSKCIGLLDALTSSSDVKLIIKVSYKNSTNNSFTTVNTYRVKIQSSDFSQVNEIRQNNYDSNHWGGGKFVAIELTESEDFIT